MKTVAIAGVGLIGGSFGLALRKAGFAGEILGVSSPSAIEAGVANGAISRSATLSEAAEIADWIYLAQPVDRIIETLERLGPMARHGCLITDAGSTKAEIVRCAERHITKAIFLGGHPLAGKEQRGAAWADGDLFRARPYVLTPLHGRTVEIEEFYEWLAHFGAQIVELSPAEHDRVVALTSHLPQLLATALANTLARQNNQHIQEIFGPGLLDMTRLALSSPDLWTSILATNREYMLEALEGFAKSLNELRDGIAEGALEHSFRTAASFALRLRNLPSGK